MRITNVVRNATFGEIKHSNIVQFFDQDGTLSVGMKVHGEQCDALLYHGWPSREQSLFTNLNFQQELNRLFQ